MRVGAPLASGALAALAVLLGAQAVAAGRVITVWVHSPVGSAEFETVQQAARAFNSKRNGVQVDIFPSAFAHYEDRVKSAAATGTLPCLLQFDGPFLAEFAWPGYLQPIDHFVSRELRNDLLPTVVAQGTYNGRLYSLAQYESGLGLWANRRYLQAAHVRIPTVAAPWTLAEFEEALTKLARVNGVDYPLDLAFQGIRNEFASYGYGPILQGFGGDLIDRPRFRSAEGVLDGPRSIEALKRIQYWLAKGWTRLVLDRYDDFARGRTALSWGGHWRYPQFRAALGPDLMLLPLPNFGAGLKTGVGSWVYGITNTCQDPAGAWAFLAHLLSTREILRATDANGALPARRSALAQSPLYRNRGPLHVYVEQLEAGAGVLRPDTPAYGTITRSFSHAMAAIVSGGSVQDALTEAARTIDQEISRNRGYPLAAWDGADH
jgi:multiple sugar transport system substrate-binding protein